MDMMDGQTVWSPIFDKTIHLLQQRCNVTCGNFILLIIMLNFKLNQVSVPCEKCRAG